MAVLILRIALLINYLACVVTTSDVIFNRRNEFDDLIIREKTIELYRSKEQIVNWRLQRDSYA